ncbi:NAD-dependent deacylase [Dechloromonas sp. HYN0024]|uniref:NAD-dependent deacylase n=1 Tax=Dechloromonas sp. HYN0024 TaxID=2231055 RepID=UPI000E443A01|nr:NAD-dependent deacylase [Dechloromonas sp. HYN0024]AXS79982.1 NAD-dependent deacylase [Dechloromonas sp. HYN0024]
MQSYSPAIEAALDGVAEHLRHARRVLFITGAGISADSGLPTYRGVGGLYDSETTEEGLRIEDALSGDVFAVRPDITWKYLIQIEENCRGARPNAAHLAIALLDQYLDRVMVFTQNVDGLHRQAGSLEIIEIHGNLQELECTECSHEEAAADLSGREVPPLCPQCGAVLRPKVVLFGEALPEEPLDRFIDAFQDGFDMVFTIGTSSIFPYITQPVVLAADSGIPTVEINPARTMLSDIVDYNLPLGAAEAMTAILHRLGLGPRPD